MIVMAVVVAVTTRGVLVAQNGSIRLFDRAAANVIWSGESVQTPSRIVTSSDQAAIIDSLANEVRIVDLASGRGTTMHTGETPIDGAFVNRELYLLDRDAAAVEHAKASLRLAADPSFIRVANGRLYVYSRASGVLQEITTNPFAVSRAISVRPFASDLEVDAKNAYLAYPRGAKVAIVSLATAKQSEVAVGAVPVDVAVISRGLAVADPSAKRVWIIEAKESFAHAFARGFFRGLLGLGFSALRNSDFPTGVDRVIVQGSRLYAYDSSSGTLYRSSKVIAKSIEPQAFSIGPGGAYIWDDAVRRLQRLEEQ